MEYLSVKRESPNRDSKLDPLIQNKVFNCFTTIFITLKILIIIIIIIIIT
jgi:hypothetical protein